MRWIIFIAVLVVPFIAEARPLEGRYSGNFRFASVIVGEIRTTENVFNIPPKFIAFNIFRKSGKYYAQTKKGPLLLRRQSDGSYMTIPFSLGINRIDTKNCLVLESLRLSPNRGTVFASIFDYFDCGDVTFQTHLARFFY